VPKIQEFCIAVLAGILYLSQFDLAIGLEKLIELGKM
jgi:hypothetical protein